jgi:D-beta-D-heptose 7-phosphate kinase/D-beta-D-heptose 1-phosphate adenosyltransferase
MEKKSTFECEYDFNLLKDKKVAVVGDLIIDYYRILKEKKLSPEGPVIVFSPVEEEIRAGGAANVANNLSELGLSVELFTALGNSEKDAKYITFMQNLHFKTFAVKKAKTTVKERLVTRRQAVARIDAQDINDLEESEAEILTNEIIGRLSEFDIVVFSDYAQGVLSDNTVVKIINACIEKKKPVIVNSKSRNYNKYSGGTLSIYNHNDAKDVTGMHEFTESDVAKFLWKSMKDKKVPRQAVALTMGPEGILLYEPERGPATFPVVNSNESEVIDVTGAGDTVTASVTAGILMDLTYSELMLLGNVAASVSIKKRGTSTVYPWEINEVRKKIGSPVVIIEHKEGEKNG